MMRHMGARDLYETDFFEWTRCNAALLRAGRFDQADIEHVAEEIEDMGKRERRELDSRLEVLLRHLLKWQFRPERRGRSWRVTINSQRRKLDKLLREMPSLRAALPAAIPEAYAYAVRGAADETDLPAHHFPAHCPYQINQIMDEAFFPNS
jgi:hypothetical protein